MKTLVAYFSAEIVDARLVNGAGEREMKHYCRYEWYDGAEAQYFY